MKYSYQWLQTHIQEHLPEPEVLREQIIFHAFEVESAEMVGDDTIFDIKVLPDRAGDCLSHYGMAREIAGLCNLTLKQGEMSVLPTIPLTLPIEVKSDLCKRYITVQIDGVTVGPSPTWLKERLESVGGRSINNIVDATNFILLDTGQPTHVYDRAKIDGGIIVRTAHVGETIVTLSEEQKTLREEMLVIADYMGALAIAGVKGGKSAEVSPETTSIVLEIAHFDSVSVRKTARMLGLSTDASKRFENNLSPETASRAAAQLVSLITTIAGGAVVGMTEYYPSPVVSRTITIFSADIQKVLGSNSASVTIEKVFNQYKYSYERKDDTFILNVPYWRNDLIGTHDIAEEIGRVSGYEHIAALPLPFVPLPEPNSVFEHMRAVRYWLMGNGYSEVMTYTFRKKGEVEVAYAPKDKSALRTNLSDGLKESADLNKGLIPLLGMTTLKLFEIGTVFFADREEIHVATAGDGVFEELTLDQYITTHAVPLETQIEPVSLVSPKPFTPWSLYPFIVRDIAVWIDGEDDQSVLEETLKAFADLHCARDAYIVDTFTKDGRISVAYRLIFQSFEHTLTDNQVNSDMHILETAIRSALPHSTIR